uniref:Uncharacterized protein n=1 Tax=viral metagenome TaxID=1070528 RepID=A0A6C0ELI8_9ZZZZ
MDLIDVVAVVALLLCLMGLLLTRKKESYQLLGKMGTDNDYHFKYPSDRVDRLPSNSKSKKYSDSKYIDSNRRRVPIGLQ